MAATGELVHELDDGNFEAFIAEAPVPVLVDFWSEWCAPCRAFATVVEEVAAEYRGRLLVAKLDILPNPEVTGKYRIASTPTVLIFAGGAEVRRIVGARPKTHLLREVEAVL